MRATAPLLPVREGKQRLLASCAIAAGIVALAYGGPALAQVAGTGSFTSGTGSINSNAGTNTTTVNVDGAQSIINWIPTDGAATGGAIDFLPVGENWNFNGGGDYTVLNRFVDSGGGALSRQIALNGTVNSTDFFTSGGRGGNIWFYNAGGILIGATGVINVGSLVLTTNDIITTGGLFGPGGTIRFNGASGSTSAITVNGAINANNAFNAGSAYVALVAPRVVQAGAVRVDGSAAYVAAEQAEIRINGGLFDINVTTGAEGGNAITHTGTTTGPAHQQGDTDQSRIYMVAIPKNDAVTMLVSGAIGYDDALSAQVDPDGAVRLSAGYNIVAGELAATPVNATAANITAGDTLFRSNTIARASGAFAAAPTQQLPTTPPPLSSAGQFFVEGSGTFIGDASATLTIGAGQRGGATGTLTVQSGGANGAAGNAAVNVTGGTLSAPGALTIRASGVADAVTGNAQGGTASLTITGGSVTTSGVTVEANGIGDLGTSGVSGNGRGGNASITVSNSGSILTAGNIFINALGRGDFNFVSGPPAINGDGTGGTASLTVANGGSVGPAALLSLDARGIGGIGTVQSGNGTGGTARIQVSGPGSFLSTTQSFVQAGGTGGGSIAGFLTQNGGTGTGGTAEVLINTDAASTISLGALGASALGVGGNASGSENARGGDALGGTATLTVDGGVNAQFTAITLNASAQAGTALSPSGTSGQTGNSRANDVAVTATNNSTITSSGAINLFAVGMGIAGENFGTGTGGDVAVNATAGGTIATTDRLTVQAMGGSMSTAIGQSAGNGIGGNVDFLADGGTIRAEVYDVNVSSNTVNVTGTGGTAQGGTIDLLARGGGQIVSTLDSPNQLNASARTGASASGTSATGGAIRLIANAGTIDLGAGATAAAGGLSGGAITPGTGASVGTGGSILIQVVADALDSSVIRLGDFDVSAEGRTQVDYESSPGLPRETSGSGRGGTIDFDIQGGTLDASAINASANGYGGNGASDRSLGTGGTATFTQTGGAVNIADLVVSADGFGGIVQGQSGAGFGGTATIDLLGGTINATDILATANGEGGQGSFGTDDDPLNIIPGGVGGQGRAGNATINIAGSAVVTASVIEARAVGLGGTGGEFFNFSSFSGVPGAPGAGGEGIGGDASINVTGGTTTANGMIANAAGLGGEGGNSFFSSSSGAATGIGVGGTGGAGRGGSATIALATPIGGVGSASSVALGTGGAGGTHNVGGAGGDGVGGTAQAIVTGFEAGELAVSLDSTGSGGNGGDGRDGAGGNGGKGAGGTSRMLADGAGASLTAIETNFIGGGVGGNGGAGGLAFSASPAVAPSGGNGGNGQGGTIEIAADEGGIVTLGILTGDSIVLGSSGTGGNGGNASNGGFFGNTSGGNGGNGGAGTGGAVRLVTTGGTITSNGEDVDISVTGTSGTGGTGGAGQGTGANGANGGFSGTAGGRVLIDALSGSASGGQIALGATNIAANGDIAGRIELRAQGNLSFAGLNAAALGSADPTTNNTDEAPTGIFAALNGGTISSQGDVTLTTDSSVGVYAQSNGIFDVDGILTIAAGDQIDIRHEFREGEAATIRASDSLIASAVTSISAAPGSLFGAGETLSLSVTGVNGTIGVDRLDGVNITLTSNGATSVEHAEADNDFTATAGSFRTGLNSIITGGDIVITSPGAVDLGNSTAGGFVQVTGQSIVFNNIDAGLTVGLSADGTAAGAEGIRGGSITAGGDINLFANSIALTGTTQGTASLFAFAGGGNVGIGLADVDGNIGIVADGDVTGSYAAGGNITLTADGNIVAQANATGGYVDGNGITAEGYVLADADGNATLTGSSAATMLGVHAGQAASLTTATAGEDVLVVAGATAALANVTAGDDLTVTAPAGITANGILTTGAGADNRTLFYGPSSSSGLNILQIATSAPDLSNISLTAAAGNIVGGNMNAFHNLTAAAAGAVTATGLLQSGLATDIDGASITFAAINAGSTVDLSATGTAAGAEGIRGTGITAGGTISLAGNSVALTGLTTGGASLFATATGGGATINRANVAGDISVSSTGNLGGTYIAGGDVLLNSGANIIASATANGGFLGSSGIADGNIFVDAAGDVTLTGSRAARMLGVHADGSATIEFTFAGEDALVVTGGNLAFENFGAGDDMTIQAAGRVDGQTLGAGSAVSGGPDTRTLTYAPGSGFAIAADDGASGSYGSDLSITARNGVSGLGLSAGDDLTVASDGPITIFNAITSGFGNVGAGSDIRIRRTGISSSAATTLSSVNSANDIFVDTLASASFNLVFANRNIRINARPVSLDTRTGTGPNGELRHALSANGNIFVSATSLNGGGISALGDLEIRSSSGGMDLASVSGRNMYIENGGRGLTLRIGQLTSTGTPELFSWGILDIGNLISAGPVSADAVDRLNIASSGNLNFSRLTGLYATVRTRGDLFIGSSATFRDASFHSDGQLTVNNYVGLDAQFSSGGAMLLSNVNGRNSFDAVAGTSLTANGIVTGRTVSIASDDIIISPNGSIGVQGTTEALSITNSNSDSQTFIGGTGTRGGYHLDADELTRLHGMQIEVFAPKVQAAGSTSVGSAAPPDVIVDSFTLTGGAFNSNFNTNGSLTIQTPGKMRVIGNVQLTGLNDTNTLNLIADDALEVILGQGSVRLLGTGTAPGGQLNMVSDDIIVATQAAITAVGAATGIDAINARLGQNDGVLLDEGALFARGIRADVAGGFYVQNSGAGTAFGERRGLTFGAGGLTVQTQGPSRITINGVQLGANGQVTGLDVIPVLTIAPQASGVPGTYDPRSTVNGCFIANPAACTALTSNFENGFPVQDVIEEEIDSDDDGDGDGNNLPQPLITMRELDPLTGEPLLDDPVTGAGNDDLWTAPTEQP